MGDFQFWFYILLGVIYLLSRFLKKPAEKPTDVPEYKPEKPVRRFETPTVKPSASPRKTLTFEELLREITESKAPPVQQPTSTSQEYTNYEEDLEEEEQDLEDVNYNYKKDKVASAYEDAKQHAFSRSSLEETMSIRDTDITFGKFKVFDLENQSNLMGRYLSDFNDLEGLKKAIVMSEILQRKF
jgi:hypothetical protein